MFVSLNCRGRKDDEGWNRRGICLRHENGRVGGVGDEKGKGRERGGLISAGYAFPCFLSLCMGVLLPPETCTQRTRGGQRFMNFLVFALFQYISVTPLVFLRDLNK